MITRGCELTTIKSCSVLFPHPSLPHPQERNVPALWVFRVWHILVHVPPVGGINVLKSNVSYLYKVKYKHNIWSKNHIPRNLLKRNENITPSKHTNGYSNIVHNSQKLDSNQVSSNWWMDKPTVIHPCNGIHYNSAIKRNNWYIQQHRCHILYNSIYIAT